MPPPPAAVDEGAPTICSHPLFFHDLISGVLLPQSPVDLPTSRGPYFIVLYMYFLFPHFRSKTPGHTLTDSRLEKVLMSLISLKQTNWTIIMEE